MKLMMTLVLLLNLNTATLEELDRLPGIGPVIARRIVEFREMRNGFRRVEELLAIQGISERMWQELKELVEVPPLNHGQPTGDSEEVANPAADAFHRATQEERTTGTAKRAVSGGSGS